MKETKGCTFPKASTPIKAHSDSGSEIISLVLSVFLSLTLFMSLLIG